MSNSNLKTFDNFYANLAQSAYTGRPNNFPPRRNSKKSELYNYSTDILYDEKLTLGGQDLPHGGKVYLQPDPTLHIERDIDLPVVDDDSELVKKTKSMVGVGDYYKGLMTDEKAGFNSYFLTDTPTLGKDTTKTYMAIRGSDGL